MKCKLARTNIALWVGHDLESESARELEQHCARCEGCFEHWREMKSKIDVLQQTGSIVDASSFESIWPSVSAQLDRAGPVLSSSRLNDFVAALVIVAACVLVAVVTKGPATGHGAYNVGPGFNLDSLPASYEAYYADPSWGWGVIPPGPMLNESPILNVDF